MNKLDIKQKKKEPEVKFNIDAILSQQRKLELALIQMKQYNQGTFYQSLKYKGSIYNIGDYLQIYDVTLKQPYVCIIKSIAKPPPNIQTMPFIQVYWCVRKKNLPQSILKGKYGNHISVAQIFPSDITCCLFLQSIKGKCEIYSLDVYSKLSTSLDFIYFKRAKYIKQTQKLQPDPSTWKSSCICQMPDNPDLKYILCDKCQKWYHEQCAQLQNSQQTFVCMSCIKETSSKAESDI